VATVELLLSPLPIHVRTARLIGVAAARRAGLGAEVLDELRLAVGEACSRAVALHAAHAPGEPVQLLVRDDPTGLTVEVVDRGPESGPVVDDVEQLFGEDDIDPRVSLAVIAGLVDDVTITPSATGTSVLLRWPLTPRAPAA
jgi:anti-sigma regulatory factor (Ser/Thr protein kinase)